MKKKRIARLRTFLAHYRRELKNARARSSRADYNTVKGAIEEAAITYYKREAKMVIAQLAKLEAKP